MAGYVMALDAGTTSNRCILFDREGRIVSVAQREFRQIFPKPGWVEHDPKEIWDVQLSVMREALLRARLCASDIAAIGITNQRETTVVWDRTTGQPVHNAIVWQCRRTAETCDALNARGLGEAFRAKTGLVIDAYFSGTKLKWILEHVAGARERARAGELLFGTIDSWLIWNLTLGRVHATDYTNASRTLLFNINELKWDQDILREFDIPNAMLPAVFPSSHVYGHTDGSILGAPVAITGAAGDQQASLFGQLCFQRGDVKNTYGTGCFMLMHTGDKPAFSRHGLLTTIACNREGGPAYALEGSVFIAGAAIQWLRDGLKLIDSADESEALAKSVPDTQGVYLVPAFTGLGAPHWDPYARGAIVGLTRGVGRAHLVRAALEAIAYQTRDVLSAMREDAAMDLSVLKVDGGASKNGFLLQFQSDILNMAVERPACVETTALGAAYLVGLAVGYWHSTDELAKNRAVEATFQANMDDETRAALLCGWERAIGRARGWAKGDSPHHEGDNHG